MKKNKWFKIYFIVLSLFVFLITIVRSIKMSITFDEALTYLNFVNHKWSWTSQTIANNHLLNTIFIMLLTKITNLRFNEFIMRIPNLIFYIVYIIYTYKISKLYKNKFIVVNVLLLNYATNEFFGLARGYGIASAFVLIAIYYYKKWLQENDLQYLKKSLLIFLMSALANTITLIIFGCFVLDSFIRMIHHKTFKDFLFGHKLFVIFLCILFYLLLIYHFYISLTDHNLSYCLNQNSLYCLIDLPLNYYGISFIRPVLIYILIIISVLLFLLNLNKIKIEYDNLFYMIIIIILFLIIFKIILPFNLPSGRTLIPFLSVYIISFIDFINLFSKIFHIKCFNIFIIVLCYISFVKNVNINYVREWKDDYKTKSLVQLKYKNKEMITSKEIKENQILSFLFYYTKYKELYSYRLMDDNDYINLMNSLSKK